MEFALEHSTTMKALLLQGLSSMDVCKVKSFILFQSPAPDWFAWIFYFSIYNKNHLYVFVIIVFDLIC